MIPQSWNNSFKMYYNSILTYPINQIIFSCGFQLIENLKFGFSFLVKNVLFTKTLYSYFCF